MEYTDYLPLTINLHLVKGAINFSFWSPKQGGIHPNRGHFDEYKSILTKATLANAILRLFYMVLSNLNCDMTCEATWMSFARVLLLM